MKDASILWNSNMFDVYDNEPEETEVKQESKLGAKSIKVVNK